MSSVLTGRLLPKRMVPSFKGVRILPEECLGRAERAECCEQKSLLHVKHASNALPVKQPLSCQSSTSYSRLFNTSRHTS